MRMTRLLLAATAAVLVAATSLAAQVTLETNSGSTYTGTIVSVDATSVEMTAEGQAIKLPLESLTQVSQYRVKSSQTPADAKSQCDLAEWCVDKTLYEEARNHFRKALAADASMSEAINAKVVVARKKAANELLARAKSLQATKPGEARRLLSAIVQELPLEDAAKEARQLLAAETAARKARPLDSDPKSKGGDGGEAPADAPKRDSGEPFSAETYKLFEPIIESYKKMLDATQEGLVKGDTSGLKEFESALKEGEKIRKANEKLRPQAKDNDEIAEAVARVDSKLEEADVDVRLNMVDSYLLRTSYNQAADVVKEGMAMYPKNESLRSAMGRVTAASSDNGGGDWVIVGRR